MNGKRVTMSDVAEKAGVHVTTVSLALRNHRRLPEATRLRIQALAQEMGYTPDPLLRALVAYRGRVMDRRNTPTLAYVTNWSTQWGWKKVTAHPEFYAGALAKANELGYNLEHFWLRGEGMSQERLGQILHSRGISGLVIASHGREMGDVLDFAWEHFSAVKIDYFPHRPAVHNVTNNQCDIVRMAIHKVVSAGYRRIGFVMHRGWDHAVDHLWTAGYLCEQQVLPEHERIPAHMFPEPEPVERWLNESAADVSPDPAAFMAWFREYRPEVIISKASFVLPLLRRMNVEVPRDVAFVDVFQEDDAGRIAGVKQNHTTVGALAIEILAGQLQHNKYGVPEIPTTTFVEGTWRDGASCPLPAQAKEESAARAKAPRRKLSRSRSV